MVAVAGAVLGGPGAVALADQSQTVTATMYQPGSATPTTKSVSVAALGQGCTRYGGPDADLSPSGVKYVFPQSSWSLRTVLECGLNQSVAAITAVEVQKPSGAWEDPLTPADLSAAGDFAGAGAVPVVSDDGTGIVYTRPQRTPADANGGDQVIHPASLALDVYEGPLLSVAVHPGTETVPVGTSVSFTASVVDVHGNPADPATLAYTWSLDGTPSSQSRGFSQTFASAGRYTITGTVNDTKGGGGSGTVQITVGSSQDSTPGSQNSNAPGTSQQPGAPATGPQQSAGTTPGGGPGARTPSQNPATSKTTGARPPGTAPPKKTRVTPATPKTTPAAPTPVAVPAPNAGTPVTGPPPSVAPGRQVPVISGRLISNVTLLRPELSPLVKIVASHATAPAVARPTRTSILPALGGVLAVVLLLGLGAGHQQRWRLRPVWRLVVG